MVNSHTHTHMHTQTCIHTQNKKKICFLEGVITKENVSLGSQNHRNLITCQIKIQPNRNSIILFIMISDRSLRNATLDCLLQIWVGIWIDEREKKEKKIEEKNCSLSTRKAKMTACSARIIFLSREKIILNRVQWLLWEKRYANVHRELTCYFY